jgi:hypothetical protein
MAVCNGMESVTSPYCIYCVLAYGIAIGQKCTCMLSGKACVECPLSYGNRGLQSTTCMGRNTERLLLL